MDCEVEQRGLPGLAIIGLGEERQLSEAPMIVNRAIRRPQARL